MARKIIFVRSLLTAYGGAEHTFALLACELKRRGYDIAFVTRPPINKAHPYHRMLVAAGIRVLTPSVLSKNRLLRALEVFTRPFLFVPYVIYRRKSIKQSWASVCSIAETWLVRLEERLFMLPFKRLKRKGEEFIIHICGPEGRTPLLAYWGKRNGVPVVYTESVEADEVCIKNFGMKWTLEAINDIPLVICCGPRVAENIRNRYSYRGLIETIPFLIEERKSLSAGRRESNGTVVLGSVGRLVEHKRYQDVIWALSELRRDGYAVELVVAGDGPMKPLLERQAREMKVEDAVTFIGTFGDISEVMAKIDVFVLPSFSEAQPLAITEAMSYGKPVVSSHFGGIPDMVENGASGFLIQPGDRDGLLSALTTLVRNPDLRREMGDHGRRLYNANRTTEVVVGRIEKAYGKVLSGMSDVSASDALQGPICSRELRDEIETN